MYLCLIPETVLSSGISAIYLSIYLTGTHLHIIHSDPHTHTTGQSRRLDRLEDLCRRPPVKLITQVPRQASVDSVSSSLCVLVPRDCGLIYQRLSQESAENKPTD